MKAAFELNKKQFEDMEQTISFTLTVRDWRGVMAILTDTRQAYPASEFLSTLTAAVRHIEEARTGAYEADEYRARKIASWLQTAYNADKVWDKVDDSQGEQ